MLLVVVLGEPLRVEDVVRLAVVLEVLGDVVEVVVAGEADVVGHLGRVGPVGGLERARAVALSIARMSASGLQYTGADIGALDGPASGASTTTGRVHQREATQRARIQRIQEGRVRTGSRALDRTTDNGEKNSASPREA